LGVVGLLRTWRTSVQTQIALLAVSGNPGSAAIYNKGFFPRNHCYSH
jgi:hypothetical protein